MTVVIVVVMVIVSMGVIFISRNGYNRYKNSNHNDCHDNCGYLLFGTTTAGSLGIIVAPHKNRGLLHN